ncbi:MAG: hypothetical protein ACFN1E_02430, partial [Prevotella melaninogenica]
EEFREIYIMEVITVPTNKPVIRVDSPVVLYPTLDAKFNAVVDDIKKRHWFSQIRKTLTIKYAFSND